MSSEGGTWARQTCGAASLKNGYNAGENQFSRTLLFVNINRSFYWGRTVALVHELPPVQQRAALLFYAGKGCPSTRHEGGGIEVYLH